jgi:hypothetical protein
MYYKQKLIDREEIRRGQRQTSTGPVGPRESITIVRVAISRKREYYRQKEVAKRERRAVFGLGFVGFFLFREFDTGSLSKIPIPSPLSFDL